MAIEEKITIPSGGGPLEGCWQAGKPGKAVVITHPHPLYGGTMNNPVVETVQSVYRQHGYATLRFNFRGVGGSSGHHDHGGGEQDDVRAAVAFVENMNGRPVDLAGYSFGAWVNSKVAADSRIPITCMIMISPPVKFIEFDNAGGLRSLKLVVTGSRDDIAPVDQIRDLLPAWNPDAQFEIIEGCDHFYAGHLDSLQSILTEYLASRELDGL